MKQGDAFKIGIDTKKAESEAVRRFPQWENGTKPIYSHRAAAEKAEPRAFEDVESRYNRAGYIHREYPLKDGRTVVKIGNWWEVPEPGGSLCVYYFK